MDKIAVLIPCYNEYKTIGKVVSDFRRVLPDAKIYVYDNNSCDGTDRLAREQGAIVRYERRQGKGNVIKSMFRDIEAECFIMVDGDDTYSARQASEMADLILNKNYDMVIGDRLSSTYFSENKRRFHNMGNKLVRKFVNKLFLSDIADVMTGYRAFSRAFVKGFPVISHGFEIETEMTIHALYYNAAIISLPVDYRDRTEGSVSKLNTGKDGMRVLLKIFNMYKDYKPIRFFGIFSLIFIAIGIILFIPVLSEYLDTGLVPKLPSLVAAGIFLVLSLVSFVTGIILDFVSVKSRHLYEVLMIMQKDIYHGKE